MENKFSPKNDKFVYSEWQAPRIYSPREIKEHLDEMNLVGRTIHNIRFIGYSYFHQENWIENHVYINLPDDMSEDQKHNLSRVDNIPSDFDFFCNAKIDDPCVILFENSETFEIDALMHYEYRFSMNCIPWDSDSADRVRNVDAGVLFSQAIGKRITEVEATVEYDEVMRIVLWLENDIGICISSWSDYCDVACIDRSNVLQTIPYGELKKGIIRQE